MKFFICINYTVNSLQLCSMCNYRQWESVICPCSLNIYLLCHSVCRVDGQISKTFPSDLLRVRYISPLLWPPNWGVSPASYHHWPCKNQAGKHTGPKEAIALVTKSLSWRNFSMPITNQGKLFSPVHKVNLTVISLSLYRNGKLFKHFKATELSFILLKNLKAEEK